MDRVDYQNLRFEVECAVSSGMLDTSASSDDVTNSVMRLFLRAIASQEVKRQRINRDFKQFRRGAEIKSPGWAYREPGISDRLPTL